MRRKIYLAGPEVFLAESRAIGVAKQALCAAAGFDGLYPGDMAPAAATFPAERARLIFGHCIAMMRSADLVIANLTPFRGLSGDVGTVFELGYMQALGKPSFAYTNVPGDFLERVRQRDPHARYDATQHGWIDGDGIMIEAFGQMDNLMLESGLAAAAVRRDVPAAHRYTDLDGFRACLTLAQQAA